MALPTASDNAFPSLLLTEQGSAPASPASGKRRLYVLSADHLAYLKDSAGGVVQVLTDKGALDNYFDLKEQGSNPASPGSTYERVFAKSDGVYVKNSAGTVTGPFGTGGGGGGGITHSYLGYNTIGGSTENMTNNRIYLKKITVSTAGIITSIGAYIDQQTDHVFGLSAGLWADNSGVPGKIMGYVVNPQDSLLMEIGVATYSPNWVHVPIGVYATAADYWIGVMGEINAGTQRIYYDGSGSDHYIPSTGYWLPFGGRYTETTTSNKYSIRASIIS